MVEPHLVGVAPAKSSSQRGQPFVFLPKTGPPQLCFVEVLFVQAIFFSFSAPGLARLVGLFI
jgi:hypothetical protein